MHHCPVPTGCQQRSVPPPWIAGRRAHCLGWNWALAALRSYLPSSESRSVWGRFARQTLNASWKVHVDYAIKDTVLRIDRTLLKFHCTGCGNCCREPLLPITDLDLLRLIKETRRRPKDLVSWVSAQQIDLDDEPEAFVRLGEGKRVMTLRQRRSGCIFLGIDRRCTIYAARPTGCRVFPFDTKFGKTGKLTRLKLIAATDCPYDLAGNHRVCSLRTQQLQFLDEMDAYHAKVAAFNQLQRQRLRQRRSLLGRTDFFRFIGIW
jgi:Fe-S-cluster containining protein